MHKEMFGNTVYRLRKRKKLSRRELGKLLGVNEKTVNKWEAHKECPSVNLLPLLVELLNDTEGDLFLYYYDFLEVA
ncbi:MAG: helix-turn-helix domain-containing protein [Treponema sp.]|jgi:transcriptional regulator with XRE-family HTH domain|nr:helix-turn-helix domain-containing protein [Treponema sp.]